MRQLLPFALVSVVTGTLLLSSFAVPTSAADRSPDPGAAAAAVPAGTTAPQPTAAQELPADAGPPAAQPAPPGTPLPGGGSGLPSFVLGTAGAGALGAPGTTIPSQASGLPGERPVGTTESHASRSVEPAAGALAVRDTLFLGNGTLRQGDATPSLGGAAFAAFDPTTGLLYITYGGDDVLVVDPSQFAVVGRWNVSAAAGNLVYDGFTGQLLIESSGVVLGVDPGNGTVAFRIPVPDAAAGQDGTIVFDPDTNALWVTNPYSANVSVVDLANGTLLAQRAVGGGFNDVLAGVYDPTNGQVYLSYYEAESVLIFNGSTLQQVANVSIPQFCCFAWGLGLDAATGDVFVSAGLVGLGAGLVELSPSTDTVVGSVRIGGFPSNLAYDPGTGDLYVPDAYRNLTTVVDPKTLTILYNMSLPQDPAFLYGQVLPVDVASLGRVFVPIYYSDTLDAVSTVNRTDVPVMHFGSDPYASVYDPACSCDAIADSGRDTLDFVDAASMQLESTVPLEGEPYGVAYDNRTHDLWITLAGLFVGRNGIQIVNGSTGATVATLGDADLPWGIAYDPSSDRMFVADYLTNEVRVLNASNRTAVAELPLGNNTDAVLYDAASGDIFTANWGSQNVSVVNGTTDALVATFAMPGAPFSLGYDPLTEQVLVGDASGQPVRLLNASSLATAGSLPVTYVAAFAYDPSNGAAILFNETAVATEANLTTDTLASIPIGQASRSGTWVPGVGLLANDGVTGAVYLVANAPVSGLITNVTVEASPESVSLGGTLHLVTLEVGGIGSPTYSYSGLPSGCASANRSTLDCAVGAPGDYAVEVSVSDSSGYTGQARVLVAVVADYAVDVTREEPLRGGTWWFAVYGGPAFSSNDSSIELEEPNGTYGFSLGVLHGAFEALPPHGSFTVGGAAVAVPANFVSLYQVTFMEAGLPANLSWTLVLGGTSRSTSGTSLMVPAANGTWNYTTTSEGYGTGPGNVSVAGANASVGLTFVVWKYTVAFTESGLPAGTDWTVTLGALGQQSTSNASTIGFTVPNGTINYTVGPPPDYLVQPGSGTVRVDAASLAVPVRFALGANLEFTESRLPAGAWWEVAVEGNTSLGAWDGSYGTDLVSFAARVPVGATYSYQVSPFAGLLPEPAQGNVTVNASGAAVDIVFTDVPYSITFRESGLPATVLARDGWRLEVDGTVQVLYTSSVTFAGPDAFSLPYLVTGPKGYRLTGMAPSGLLAYSSENLSESVTFVPGTTSTLRFTETGVPRGHPWCVNVSGQQACGNRSSLVYTDLSPGNYPYAVVSPVSGEVISAKLQGVPVADSGSVNVTAGKATAIALKFVHPYAVTFTAVGLPPGSSWTVTVRGVPRTSTGGGPLVFELPNGTYGYRVTFQPGYTIVGNPREVHVAGSPVAVTVTISVRRSHGGNPGGPVPEVPASALPLGPPSPAASTRRSR